MNPYNRIIDRSGSNAEKYALRQKLFGTDEVLPMWVADMDIPTPQCVLDAVKERLEHPVIGYEMMSDNAYNAQIRWFEKQHNFMMQREWLSYSPSVVASIGCAIRALSDEGDEVIVMDPVYPPFYSMVKNNSRKLIIHSLERDQEGIYRFSIDRLRTSITSRTRLLLLCSPHNPVGRVWSEQELRELGDFCCENGIRIISDEIHCDITLGSNRHLPIASLSEELLLNTVTLIGPGKTFNMAGFSISTVCIASETLRKSYEAERSKVHWGDGNILAHTAFEAAYRDGYEWYRGLVAHLEQNLSIITEWMAEHEQLRFHRPEGTYLAWIDCRKLGLGDRELREFFVHKAGLGLSPGLSFGKEGSGFMRLNFAVSGYVLIKALGQLEKALNDK